MHVSELWIYPIKSCKGISVDEITLDDRGPIHDRRWMLVHEDGTFITARTHHKLILVDVALQDDEVIVSYSGEAGPALRVGAGEQECVIWNDEVVLQRGAQEASDWFSDLLGEPVQLMHMPASTERVVNPEYSPQRKLVTLADGYPLMLIGEGSLTALNQRLIAKDEHPVPMKRFRPNVVVAGSAPHDEDKWKRVRIGDGMYDVVKPCERCAIPTIDTETGIAGKEPSRTLAEYRKRGSKIYFGQNLVHAGPATMRVNDAVSAVS